MSSTVQKFALIFGLAYGLVGVLGFVPGATQAPPPDAPPVAIGTAYGYLFGLFPVNAVHNLVHIGVGALGMLAAGRFATARLYSRAVAIVFALLTVMGLLPGLATTFGLIPLFGADVGLHAITAVAGVYFGWLARDASDRIGMPQTGRA